MIAYRNAFKHRRCLIPAEGFYDNQDADGLLALLKPADPERWTTHPVSWQVNSPRTDGSELLEPVASVQ